jgi:hypothetical protein
MYQSRARIICYSTLLVAVLFSFACKPEPKSPKEELPFTAGADQCVVTLQVSGMS